MQYPTVLVGCPTYDKMRYCHEDFFKGIKSLTYPNHKILIVDNSEGDEYFNELKKEEGILVMKDNCNEKEKMERLVSSRNKIIEYALENNYDYLLTLDADVVPPKDIIEELMNCKKDVVSGVYFNYFISSGQLKWLPVAWASLSEEEFEAIKKQAAFPPIVKTRFDLRRHLTKEELESGKLLEVQQPSMGCTLSARRVFEKARHGVFKIPGVDPARTGEDAYYFKKAQKEGFEPYVHTKIRCEHLIEGKYQKDEKGEMIHPSFK